MELCGFAFCFFLQQWLLQEVVNKFQNDPKYSVLLATAQEGACFARFARFAQNEWALRMHDFGVTCEVETLHVFGPWSKLKPNTWPGPVTHDLSSSLTSSQVGGVGLTLTAANHVIHFDRPYNPAREDQAPGVVQGSIRSIQQTPTLARPLTGPIALGRRKPFLYITSSPRREGGWKHRF